MWMHTLSGYLNSRYVKRVMERRHPGRDGKERWAQFAEVRGDDRETEILGRVDFDEERAIAVIPALVPMTLLEVCYDPADPNEGGFWTESYPIIGWRIRDMGYPEPVAIGTSVHWEDRTDNCIFVIELLSPYRGYREAAYEGEYFKDIAECKVALKRRCEAAQAGRERRSKIEEKADVAEQGEE